LSLPDAGIDEPAVDDVAAFGDVGLEGGDVVGLVDRRFEQRLLTRIELDVRRQVVPDRLLECGAGGPLASSSIPFCVQSTIWRLARLRPRRRDPPSPLGDTA
jgi:hypothetical protein